MIEKLKQNKIVIAAAIVILIIVIILTIGTVRKSKQKAVIKSMFEDIKTGNVNKIIAYINNETITAMDNNPNENDNEELKILLTNLEYKIKSTKTKGNKCEAKVVVSNKDSKTTLKNYFSTVFAKALKNISSNTSSDDIVKESNNYLREEYEKADTITTELKLELVKEKNGWEIDKSQENGNRILNAVLPGFLEYLQTSDSAS